MPTRIDITPTDPNRQEKFTYNNYTYHYAPAPRHMEKPPSGPTKSFAHPKSTALTIWEYKEYRDNV